MGTILSTLYEQFDAEQILVNSESLADFSRDALRPHRGFTDMAGLIQEPLAVVQPKSTDEIVRLVSFARQHHLPLVPYGGGSGLMGGALSVRPGIVVDMNRMDTILAVDQQALTVRVQSGLRLRPLGEQLAERDLLLGHDPWSISIATVGGAIGTHGLGYLGGRYGSIGDQVLGMEVVLGTGEILRTPALRKRSTGPDFARLFIGAEGTLGIVTEATLQVFPQPEQRSLIGFSFPDFATGFHALIEMRQRGVQPTSLDMAADSWHIDLQERRGFPPPQPPYLHLVFDGLAGEVAAHCTVATRIAQGVGGSPIAQEELQDYWRNRHAIADRWALDPELREGKWLETAYGESQFDFLHLTIPVSRLLDFRTQALTCMRENSVFLCEEGVWIWPECYAFVLYCPQTSENDAAVTMRRTTEVIYQLVHQFGGSMEYVHGVGVRLGHLMARELGSGMNTLRSLKALLDPDGIMNPGKLGLD